MHTVQNTRMNTQIKWITSATATWGKTSLLANENLIADVHFNSDSSSFCGNLMVIQFPTPHNE